VEERNREWEGSPLDLMESGIDPYGIKEIVIEFGDEEKEILRPKLRDEFQSYEIQQAAHYVEALLGHKNARRSG